MKQFISNKLNKCFSYFQVDTSRVAECNSVKEKGGGPVNQIRRLFVSLSAYTVEWS